LRDLEKFFSLICHSLLHSKSVAISQNYLFHRFGLPPSPTTSAGLGLPFAWLRAFVAQNDSQDRFAGLCPSPLTVPNRRRPCV
jgi:hypothetical protein